MYRYLSEQGVTLTKFEGPQAVRNLVAPAAQGPAVEFITGSGHGFQNRFTGQARLSIFELGQYQPVEVRNKIIHLLSCQTAGQLGADVVTNGCRAFFGYDVDFLFPLDRPAVFLDCDSVIDLRLADGMSAEDAYAAAVQAFDDTIATLKKNGQAWLAAMLEFNRDHLCSPSVDRKWGDPRARL